MEILKAIIKLYSLEEFNIHKVDGHYGGRNRIYICSKADMDYYVIRISDTNDRRLEDYLAEVEFVNYLAQNKALVSKAIPSINGRLVEMIDDDYVSLFEYARGMLISDNGYQYRNGAPISEYFFNTGKTLGRIHKLSKKYVPVNKRIDYFDKFNEGYIDRLIPENYKQLKKTIKNKLASFRELPKENYGVVHFDFSDGNYHVDMNTGDITVFDFDNCLYCWYMYDLANLWICGQGWIAYQEDKKIRRDFMDKYFNTIIEGYRSECEISNSDLENLQLFIDMVLIENIVDEFECCLRNNEEVDYQDIQDEAECLINNIPYAGFCD